MADNGKKQVLFKEVKIERRYPDNLQTHFVSNIVVQHQPDFFTISFFEVWLPPIIGNSTEEKKHILESFDHVEAKCVSRIVVTPEKMREFAKAINENLINYDALLKLQKQNQ